jgi:hypothetical protein
MVVPDPVKYLWPKHHNLQSLVEIDEACHVRSSEMAYSTLLFFNLMLIVINLLALVLTLIINNPKNNKIKNRTPRKQLAEEPRKFLMMVVSS